MKKNVRTIAGRNGGRLNAGGTPGNRGGSGRPPEEWRRWLRETLHGDAARQRFADLLQKGECDDATFLKAWTWAYEQVGQDDQSSELAHLSDTELLDRLKALTGRFAAQGAQEACG